MSFSKSKSSTFTTARVLLMERVKKLIRES